MKSSHDHRQPPRNLSLRLRRGGLVDKLTKALSGQVVLIRAAAGYGKTEVMAATHERLIEQGYTTAWLTLSKRDGSKDVATMIAAALNLPDQEPERVLKHLHERTDPVFFLFDAAEHVADRPEVLEWFLNDAPDCMRLALAGRKLPPIRISSFRLRGLLYEITSNDLAFTRDEMRQLLCPWLSQAEQETMFGVLAAWPALVSLAAAILGGQPTPLARAQLLDGRHPALRDFLIEEALASISPTGTAALLACTELPNFTLDIAADLAGLTLDEATLSELEDLPPLIVGEGQQIGWYRMHPLVAQVMPLLSGADTAELRRARHIRAATLFSQRGLLDKSVLHASLGGDYNLAVETVERAGGVDIFLRAGYTVLRRIVEAVPHDVVRRTPSLRLCRALMLSKSGRIGEARLTVDGLIDETRAGLISEAPNWMAVLEHISHLIDVYEDCDLDAAGIAELEHCARSEKRENTWRLGWLFNNLTIAYTRRGDFQSAQTNALNALSCYREEKSSYPQAFMLIHLAFVNLRANQLEAALTHSQQAETIIRSQQWSDTNLIAIAHVPLAATLYLQGSITQAEQMLERAMPVLAEGEGWVDFFAEGYATLARARMQRGGLESAEEVLQDALYVAEARNLSRLRLAMTILRTELLTRSGHLDIAENFTRQIEALLEWSTDRERRDATLALARLDLRQGRFDAAATRLDAISTECQSPECEAVLLRCALLQTSVSWARGDVEGGLAALHQAALLSLPGQQLQQFHDEGPDLAQSVRALTRKAGLSCISRQTTDYLARTASSVRSRRDHDILSNRETEILSLLDEGLTNKAIGRRLELAEPTVKFHLKNLYSKLGVSRRQLALNVAKGSGLLPP